LLVAFVVSHMSLAEDTREAVRRRPFLLAALRAGVVNYTAAARSLADEVEGHPESIATALRRFAGSLPEWETDARNARVSMQSSLGTVERSESEAIDSESSSEESASEFESADSNPDALLTVGDTTLAPGEGSLTGVVAAGDVDAGALAHVLGRLHAEDIDVRAAAVAGGSLVVAVERRDGPDAVRVAEEALEAVPSPGEE